MTLASKLARSATTSSAASGSGVRLVYSTTPSWPFSSTSSSRQRTHRKEDMDNTIDIALLDSSFNPPSRAHLALLLSPPILARNKPSYDGHLLLFSTQNADKGTGQPGDAYPSQRIEMMTLMAKDVERIQTAEGHSANVAVGLVDKPLIFSKSTLTWDLLKAQQQESHDKAKVRLHWLVGFDTLYRVFQLKYYPSLAEFRQQCSQFFEREGTTFVCARRDPSSYPQLASRQKGEEGKSVEEVAREQEDRLLQSENVAPWVQKGSVGMFDLDPDQAKLSSTKIRTLLKDRCMHVDKKRKQLESLVPPSLVKYLLESRVYQHDLKS
ncbi:uncharacterized protein UHOD_02035 [Ustilago sp. UG-2017b]|nr:uncharacterized protein UHOD_02035 [Ustilago sp. UG-2017b]